MWNLHNKKALLQVDRGHLPAYFEPNGLYDGHFLQSCNVFNNKLKVSLFLKETSHPCFWRLAPEPWPWPP
jgi:hypothetical protein